MTMRPAPSARSDVIVTRRSHIDLFSRYDSPVLNVTFEATCADFRSRAKACGVRPFAVLLHALASTSLATENFRFRLQDGDIKEVEELHVGYTVINDDGNLNFSTFRYERALAEFAKAYDDDRARSKAARDLRLVDMSHRDYLFVTCLPWMRFAAIQHPIARFADASIPNLAVGQFGSDGTSLSFPLSVQAHHGLVDGLHVAKFAEELRRQVDDTVIQLL